MWFEHSKAFDLRALREIQSQSASREDSLKLLGCFRPIFWVLAAYECSPAFRITFDFVESVKDRLDCILLAFEICLANQGFADLRNKLLCHLQLVRVVLTRTERLFIKH